VLPLSLFAQELKFGHINREALLKEMPEALEAQRKLESKILDYKTETSKLENELTKKVDEFKKVSATLDPAIRAAREAELNSMYENIQKFTATAQEELQKTQMELMMPIEDKINKAINAVGDENGFMYIFEKFDNQVQTVLYYSPKSTDILPLVRKKLGLK
jgi:outer membrane protein